jgi:magnesium-transporting ATPase (P-type)
MIMLMKCIFQSYYIRLKTKEIAGINPEKMISAGKVTVSCFDKTGTITE